MLHISSMAPQTISWWIIEIFSVQFNSIQSNLFQLLNIGYPAGDSVLCTGILIPSPVFFSLHSNLSITETHVLYWNEQLMKLTSSVSLGSSYYSPNTLLPLSCFSPLLSSWTTETYHLFSCLYLWNLCPRTPLALRAHRGMLSPVQSPWNRKSVTLVIFIWRSAAFWKLHDEKSWRMVIVCEW